MKKLKYLILMVLLSFLLIPSIYAVCETPYKYLNDVPSGYKKVECYYNNGDSGITLVFAVKGNSSTFCYEKWELAESGLTKTQYKKKWQSLVKTCESQISGGGFPEDYCKKIYTYDGSNVYQKVREITPSFAPKSVSDCPNYISYGDNANYIDSSDEESGFSYGKDKVSCGNIEKIPRKIPELTTWAVTFIQVLVPVILVIFSMVDLIKAISSQKEDEIKKGQKVLIKRIVLAAVIFLVVILVKLIISIVASATDTTNIISCINCFINDVRSCK